VATTQQEPPVLRTKERFVATRKARRRRRMRIAGIVVGSVVVVAGAAVGWALLAFPQASLGADAQGLARLHLPGLGTKLVSLSVSRTGGGAVPVRVQRGVLWPRTHVAAGEHLRVEVVVRRPSWASWLLGNEQRKQVTIVAPASAIGQRWVTVAPGSRVAVRFGAPVRRLAVRSGSHVVVRTLPHPQRVVTLPASLARGLAGSVLISSAPRTWERLSAPARVTWFPATSTAAVMVTPAPGKPLGPGQQLRLTFAQPLDEALGAGRPRFVHPVAGRWRTVDAHTLTFTPSGFGFPLGSNIALRLPHAATVVTAAKARSLRTLGWLVPQGSTMRLEQLLAEQGYLPLTFHESTPVAKTLSAQLDAAVTAPQGTFSWRWGSTPTLLKDLWAPGAPNDILRGAIMAFQDQHGLATDGFAGPLVWGALVRDQLSGRTSSAGYTFVDVTKHIPERLTLWHSGATILVTPANTGVAAAPTQSGVYPVFYHIPSGTMTGTNPDGSHYSDPGIKWISYFHGGDALHGFPRGSYGTPQSVGCVEMPDDVAGRVWPYTPIGTLVDVHD
jgi:hypothetical protein